MATAPKPSDDSHNAASARHSDDMSDQALGEACTGARRKRRWVQRIALSLASLVFMPLLLLAGFFAYLARGPVELPFLTERVAAALEEQLGSGVDVQVGRTLLDRTGEGVELHIQDVLIKNTDGKTILRSPDALLSFDPLRLMALSIVPKRLSLKSMAIRGLITPEGSVVFSADRDARHSAQSAAEVELQTRISSALAGIALFAQKGQAGDLKAVRIDDASLVIDDQRNGKTLTFETFTLQLDKDSSGAARAIGSLSKSGDRIPFTLKARTNGDAFVFTAEAVNVSQTFIAAVMGQELPLTLDGKISGTMEITTDAAGKPLAASGVAKIGAGALKIKALGPDPFALRQSTLQLNWTGDAQRIDEVKLSMSGDSFSASMSGPVVLPTPGNPWYRYHGKADRWTLAGINARDAATTVESAALTLAIRDDLTGLKVESAVFKGQGTDFSLTAAAQTGPEGPSLSVNVLTGVMPARSALRWWPTFLSPSARNFFVASVQSGQMTRFSGNFDFPPPVLQAAIRLEPLPAETFKIEVSVADIAAVITPDLPLITGLTGSATVNALQAQGSGIAASAEIRSGRRMPLLDTAFTITGLETFVPKAVFRFRSQAPLDIIAEMMRMPGLKNALGIDIDPSGIKGQLDGRASISLPLTPTLKTSDIVSQVDAKLTGVTIDNAIGKDKLENATLALKTDKNGLEVKGEGRWQALPVSLELQNNPADKSAAAALSFILDEAALKRRGINLGPRLTGPLPVKVRTLREQGEGLTAKVEIDLTRAAIDGLLPGFQKPAGRSGKLTFDASEKSGGYSIQNLVMESGASLFRGAAETLADGTVTSARLNLFRLSPGDNVRLDFDRPASGQRIIIRGNNFDARPFLKQASASGDAVASTGQGGAAERDLDIELKTTLLSGYGGEVMTNADLKAVRRGDQFRQIALSGKLNGKDIKLTGRSAGDGPASILVDVDDAGAFLRYIDVYTRMIGGALDGQITPSGRRLNGFLLARNFALRDEPALRRLVQEAPADSAVRNSASDTRFTKMRIDFMREGTQTTVKDAVIFGPQIGLTFNGVIDQERDRVSMSGTFVPAYGLNNAFSQIPVFGNLLTGSRNEGLLAVTFGVTGRASRPNITVNPLSAVTPGIFRKIFEFRNDATGNTPPTAISPADSGRN